MSEAATHSLLRRWHEGDAEALDELLRQNLPWIRAYVHDKVGPLLRRRGDTDDYVHDAMLDVLRYGQRFLLPDRDQFRALLARTIVNVLHDRADHVGAQQRDPRREQPGSVLDFASASVTSPSAAAARDETHHLVHFALELLEPEDRKVILLREWEGRPFAAVGEALGIGADAARMRFQRALPRLAGCVERLRCGDVAGALREVEA